MDAVFRSWPALPMASPQIEVLVDPKTPSVPSIVVSVPSVTTSDALDFPVRHAAFDRARDTGPSVLRPDVARRTSAGDRTRCTRAERDSHRVARRATGRRYATGCDSGLGAGAAERAEDRALWPPRRAERRPRVTLERRFTAASLSAARGGGRCRLRRRRRRPERAARRSCDSHRILRTRRPWPRAADPVRADSESARPVRFIDRSPWLRAVRPQPGARVNGRSQAQRQLEGRQ